jgi:hypothetical protein
VTALTEVGAAWDTAGARVAAITAATTATILTFISRFFPRFAFVPLMRLSAHTD